MRTKIAVSIAALSAGLLLASSASAAVNLVQNGGFELTTGSTTGGMLGDTVNATFWNVPNPLNPVDASYDWLFTPAAGTSGTNADTTGVFSTQNGILKLDGPGDGYSNGLTLSQDGGNFIGIDPAYRNGGPITQTITGLVAGIDYTLKFDWAAAQQFNFPGGTFSGWNVTLGGSPVQTTGFASIGQGGFSGWNQATMVFHATSSTEVLSFLAIGGPDSTQPPFALLDGVSLTGVPEPTTWALMIMGFGGIGAMVRNRRRQLALA